MMSMLRMSKNGNEFASWTEEIKAQSIDDNGVEHVVLGMHVRDWAKTWFADTFMDQVMNVQNKYRHLDGNVINIISTGIRSKTALLFSVLVSGIGGSSTSMWAMGRLE